MCVHVCVCVLIIMNAVNYFHVCGSQDMKISAEHDTNIYSNPQNIEKTKSSNGEEGESLKD